ncbi:Outer membrane receptor proteins, mostly Fe transport [Algoriphagus faecimaris]|uniref:Outer membrane receptor proteins, mostly Fe transport n=1 Tax=Algoriphagus faecimaris TaxID=686796 RepID=A0A1G6WAY3_9BACT|nr:TonB-dependent receptor [Algoriphagus faecimaris]SDD62216.1 Outer membrane receptor proteins, mostly Fe transport [Algoriphagus faecimaris]
MNRLLFLALIFLVQLASAQDLPKRQVIGRDVGQLKNIRITGRIIDQITGEALVGATVTIPELNQVKVTDPNGGFELMLERAEYNLEFRYVGYETIFYPITSVGDGRISIQMIQEDFQLDDVVIFGRDPEKNIRSTDMGAITLSMNSMKELPPFLGEVDIIRSMATLPGVSQVGEAAAGINVRGGGADQNLIQYAGAPIYNPTHLFGLFTSFNPDVVNDVTLYKSVIPTRFGGRGSSILDILPKTGALDRWGGDLMVSNISGKVGVNGPLVKDKISLRGGFRGSYINWFLNSLSNPDLANSQANFYDGNLVISAPISEKNEFTYSFYTSYDDFAFASDTTISWQNNSHSFQWKSKLNEKLSLEALGYYTQYDYSIFNRSGISDFDLNSGIEDYGGKLFVQYQLSPTNKITLGGDTKRLEIQPGELIPFDSQESGILPKKVQNEFGVESGVHFQHEFEIGEKFGMSYGLRYDMYSFLGPRNVRQYEANQPKSDGTAVSEVSYGEGEKIIDYTGLGPRGSIRYSLSKYSSIKVGYNKMYQFIHLISNTATIAPTDFWKLSDEFLEPQSVDQYSLGFYQNFKGNIFETSIEVYYKDIQNVVEYKDGANLIVQNHLETELVPAQGRAYGVELYAKKNLGRLTGWISYTYSRSLRRVITAFEEEIINDGDWFSSNFDKPHDITVIGNYKISTNTSVSATFGYSTGRPVTFPQAKFDYLGNSLAYFSRRNEQRLPDFHRLDLSVNFKFRGESKFADGEWTFSVLNVYGRRNPFSLFFVDEAGAPPQANRLAVLGVPLPSLSYSIAF